MVTLSTDAPISPLRRRMQHDMLMRGLASGDNCIARSRRRPKSRASVTSGAMERSVFRSLGWAVISTDGSPEQRPRRPRADAMTVGKRRVTSTRPPSVP